MGWDNEEVVSVEYEEYVDTNPDLYKQRTIAALNEHRYKDALKEAQLALNYGKQELQYHVLILRVLLEMEQYSVCYKYLLGSGLWKNRKSKELLSDERNYLYYVYARCFNECGFDISSAEMIIVTNDGKGMYKSIQSALAYMGEGRKIYLTKGLYRETLNIIGRDVSIECDDVERAVITEPAQVIKSKVRFKNIVFESDKEDVMLSVNDAQCSCSEVTFRGRGKEKKQVGLHLLKCSNVNLNNTTFENLLIGIIALSRNVNINKSYVTNNKIGILCASKHTFKEPQGAINSVDNHINKNEIGICVACNSQAKINRTFLENNIDSVLCMANSIVIQNFATEMIELGGITIYPDKLNVFLQGKSGYVEIKDSEIRKSKNVGICACDKGSITATNCKIVGTSSLGGKGYGVYAKDNGNITLADCLLENNLKAIYSIDNATVDKRNVRLLNNDVVGASLEGVKGLFKALTNL